MSNFEDVRLFMKNFGQTIRTKTQLPDNNLHVYENTSTDISLDSNNAQLILENDGAGDVGINFELSGTQRWSTYVDNTDNDIFKIKDNTNGHIPIQFAKNNGGTTISGDLDIINSGMINLFLRLSNQNKNILMSVIFFDNF